METRSETRFTKEVTLIDTYNVDYDDYLEDFKDYCKDNGYEIRGNGSRTEGLYLGGKISFAEWVGNCISDDVENFWSGLCRVKNGSHIDYYVVTGSLGLWHGRRNGICETFNSLYDALSKCATDAYSIVVKCDGNKISFDCVHHDGKNCFEIRRLSYDDYDKIRWWDDELDGNVFNFIEKHSQPITYEMIGL